MVKNIQTQTSCQHTNKKRGREKKKEREKKIIDKFCKEYIDNAIKTQISPTEIKKKKKSLIQES